MSLRLTFRAPDRTLTEAEVQAAIDAHRRRARSAHTRRGSVALTSDIHDAQNPIWPSPPQTLEIDAIERLEDKVRSSSRWSSSCARDHARLTAENKALSATKSASLRKKLVDAEGDDAELAALREERDQVRTRVSDMLAQLEALDL